MNNNIFQNANAKDFKKCTISSDGTIQELIINNQGAYEWEIIGVTKDIYNANLDELDEIELKRNEYLDLLYEHGILEKPKTQDEINAELLEQQKSLLEQQKEMAKVLKESKELINELKKENKKLKKGSDTNEPKVNS